MKFIDVILENSSEKLAKLYGPSLKANQNPENGITINNKSAYHVIKDCAYLAHMYIPIFVFDKYIDPFNQLKRKFKKNDIEEFLNSTKTDISHKQLLTLILSKAPLQNINAPVVKEFNDIEPNDPYGEYGMDNDVVQSSSGQKTTLDTLCELFGVSI
jgi:hypothetical protein